jgi:hypothetical protein
MSDPSALEQYRYKDIHPHGSFRVLELLPGKDKEPISCLLLTVDWSDPPEYEAVSYAWGNLDAKSTIICHDKKLEVGQNIHNGLAHLRFPDRSRILWVDCLW